MTARQDVARKPFSEVLDKYLEIKFFAGWLRQNAQYGSQRLYAVEQELVTARHELDDYLNEKE